MTVQDLTKQLLDFNPDAKLSVYLGNSIYTDFSLAWGALEGDGVKKEKTKSISIYIGGNKTNDEDERTKTIIKRDL